MFHWVQYFHPSIAGMSQKFCSGVVTILIDNSNFQISLCRNLFCIEAVVCHSNVEMETFQGFPVISTTIWDLLKVSINCSI